MKKRAPKKATLCFIINKKEGEILLGIKQDKVGKDMWNGPGGKIESTDRSEKHCVLRELKEETGGMTARLADFEKIGVVEFVFHKEKGGDHPKRWKVFIFRICKWSGTPKDTEEMKNFTWFPFGKIPYDQMMPADFEIVPKVIAGESFNAVVHFSRDEKTIEKIEWN